MSIKFEVKRSLWKGSRYTSGCYEERRVYHGRNLITLEKVTESYPSKDVFASRTSGTVSEGVERVRGGCIGMWSRG